jgi:hypothetical protein
MPSYNVIPPIPPDNIEENHAWREWFKAIQRQVNSLSSSSEASVNNYMLSATTSDISTYLEMNVLEKFTAGSLTTTTVTGVGTGGSLLVVFATPLNSNRNKTSLHAGIYTCHYETEKGAGSNNYYTYFTLSKRDSAGTETLILTSDHSTETAVNTAQQITVTGFLSANTSISSTDRLVLKIYGVLLSATATINIRYDYTSNSRLTLSS